MSATEKLAELQAIADEAHARREHAWDAFEAAQNGAVAECAGLVRYTDDVAWRRTNADPGRARALSVALARRILEDPDLVLVSTRSRSAQLRLDNARPARELAEAIREAAEAAGSVSQFKRQHADQLAKEAAAEAAAAIQRALNSGDPDRIREALGLAAPKALTTAGFNPAAGQERNRADHTHRRPANDYPR